MQKQKRLYIAPQVERWVLGTYLPSILEHFSGKGDIIDYEEADGFSGDGPQP